MCHVCVCVCVFMGIGRFEENEKHTQNDKLLGDFGLFARVFHCSPRWTAAEAAL